MLISKLVDKCNRGKLASEYIRQPEIYLYMDDVIMDINDRLQAKYPLVSEYATFVTQWNIDYPDTPLVASDYNVIPDEYLARIMPVGVARYFYMKDEEGEVAASDFFRQYEQALFSMVRDYHSKVPTVFQNNDGGTITVLPENSFNTTGGLMIDGNEFRL